MRPEHRRWPSPWTWLALALVVAGSAAAWVAMRQRVPADAGRGRPPPPASRAPSLLGPLRHESDERFRGRLRLTRAAGTLQGQTPQEAAAVAALETAWQQAAAADPADVGGYLDLHRRLLWLGWWNRAEEAAKVMLAAVPDHPPALALLSGARFEQGRRAEGASLARRAAAADPDLVLGIVGQARAWAAVGEFDRARSFLERAAGAEPDAPEAAFLLGCLLCDRNELEEAAAWLLRARPHELDRGGSRAGYVATAVAWRDLLGGRRPQRVAPGFDGVALPVERRGLWVVAARLEGRGTRVDGFLVLDSGASHTVVGPEALGVLRMAEQAASSMMSVAGVSASVPALVERLALGGFTIEDVPVLVDRGRQQPLGPGVIGSIGVSLLRDFKVTLDVREEVLRLDPRGSAPTEGRIDVPFELVNNLPLVRARLGGGPEREYMFDTGADALFLSPEVARQDLGFVPGDPRARPARSVAIGGQEVAGVSVPVAVPLVVGGEALPISRATVDPSVPLRNAAGRLEMAGTLGVFLRARFTLDFARQRLVVEP
jgi:hypothetical protein